MLYAAWAGVLGLRLMNWRAIAVNTVRVVVLFVPVVLLGGTGLFISEGRGRSLLKQLTFGVPLWLLALVRYGHALVVYSWSDLHTSYLDWWVRWTSERRWRWRPKS